MNLPSFLGPVDLVAVGFLIVAIVLTNRLVERCSATWPSTAVLMAGYRKAWMSELPNRELKMYDAMLMVNLRAGATFFASGCMLAIGGVIALLGQSDRLVALAQDLAMTDAVSRVAWEAKLIFIVILLVQAFLRFIWAHRIFGYCAVLMGTIPDRQSGPPVPTERTLAAVTRAGELNVTASRSFNRGMRTVYFTLAALAWFLGPWMLIGATALIMLNLFRIEFLSNTRAILLESMSEVRHAAAVGVLDQDPPR
ncbi:MAG: DUF599 family protein [Pseudomonadota bacterium]